MLNACKTHLSDLLKILTNQQNTGVQQEAKTTLQLK